MIVITTFFILTVPYLHYPTYQWLPIALYCVPLLTPFTITLLTWSMVTTATTSSINSHAVKLSFRFTLMLPTSSTIGFEPG